MRFKIDENLSESTKQILIAHGRNCHSVHDEDIAGGPDDQLIEICHKEERHLITLDLDFADIVRYPPSNYAGIIVLRLSRQDRDSVNRRLNEALKTITGFSLAGHLVIVSDLRIRYR